MSILQKKVNVELKSVSDDGSGSFEGFAAVYRNIDLGGDIIPSGALSKTLQERNWKAPILDEHKVRVGAASLEDTEYGLKTFGKLNLEKQAGREAYSDLKFYREQGMQMGMSIGYGALPSKISRDQATGARILNEIKLFEVTLTMTPMNELAAVTGFKSMEQQEEDYLIALEALHAELKSGRKISKERAARMRAMVQNVYTEFESLLQEAGVEALEATTSSAEPSQKSAEPDFHSLLSVFDRKITLLGVSN